MILTFMSNSLAATSGEHEEQSPPDNDLQREEYLSIYPFDYYQSILSVHSTYSKFSLCFIFISSCSLICLLTRENIGCEVISFDTLNAYKDTS